MIKRGDMMAVRKRKYTAKTKGRTFIFLVLFFAVILTLAYTLVSDLQKINMLNIEKKNLNKMKGELKDKQESLKADIERLSDDLYVARYAREKYFYSKEGEIILRFDE